MLHFQPDWAGTEWAFIAKYMRTQPTSPNSIPTSGRSDFSKTRASGRRRKPTAAESRPPPPPDSFFFVSLGGSRKDRQSPNTTWSTLFQVFVRVFSSSEVSEISTPVGDFERNDCLTSVIMSIKVWGQQLCRNPSEQKKEIMPWSHCAVEIVFYTSVCAIR